MSEPFEITSGPVVVTPVDVTTPVNNPPADPLVVSSRPSPGLVFEPTNAGDPQTAAEHPQSVDQPFWNRLTPDEPKMWQVKFKSGQGQQVAGPSANAVRALMATHYGADYEVLSIVPLD